ncbi:MAG: hypothetical protein J6V87_07805 [Prevotella sp.]|nr:hypothetical protein [Prevotella sp.]
MVRRVVVILGADGLIVVAHAERSRHFALFRDGATAADSVVLEVLASRCRCVVQYEAHLVAITRIEVQVVLHTLVIADDVSHDILVG